VESVETVVRGVPYSRTGTPTSNGGGSLGPKQISSLGGRGSTLIDSAGFFGGRGEPKECGNSFGYRGKTGNMKGGSIDPTHNSSRGKDARGTARPHRKFGNKLFCPPKKNSRYTMIRDEAREGPQIDESHMSGSQMIASPGEK